MTVPYTQLEGSDLWRAAKAQYDANGHSYHSMGHIIDLYGHASRLGWDYDEALDQAILAHDIIFDGGPDPEERSALWLVENAAAPSTRAVELIHSTIDHLPSHPDNRLALLDLLNFAHPAARSRSTRLLRDEAAKARGADFDQKAWVHGTLTYLKGLAERIDADLGKDPDIAHRVAWSRIRHGIRCTMATMPLNYAPHPAQGIQRYTRNQEALLLRLNEGDMTTAMMADFTEGEEIPRSEIPKLMTRLKDEGLVVPGRRIDAASVTLTEEGRSWCERMLAPEEDWPEPEV